jgi:hypothetical protein
MTVERIGMTPCAKRESVRLEHVVGVAVDVAGFDVVGAEHHDREAGLDREWFLASRADGDAREHGAWALQPTVSGGGVEVRSKGLEPAASPACEPVEGFLQVCVRLPRSTVDPVKAAQGVDVDRHGVADLGEDLGLALGVAGGDVAQVGGDVGGERRQRAVGGVAGGVGVGGWFDGVGRVGGIGGVRRGDGVGRWGGVWRR